ncbi:uncharacterized protein PV06_09922 [Exophiala oligosperma]|uniref:Methyltransferase domain-containing protein n=2 Tax=Chaetothyriales TaxID=34395 RepID=A0A0D2DQ42_9EURO|nr:uncharacterized protein PV06_09922 [Exophiala oligosperma]KAJ9639185.1 hypothetical protein H2204_003796 [Knufia peltigerae]KIW37944.1 hypothetical protein PV06_09922 [Exophiala oligosperma]
MDTSGKDKTLVREGYNQIAQTYLQWTSDIDKDSLRVKFLEKLLSYIKNPSTGNVLELGCGAGIPSTKILAERCQEVFAVDISDAQIDMAKANVVKDNVKFIREDMTELKFGDGSLSAVAAFYSILHLPREEQVKMFKQIWNWLEPGGFLLCNLGVEDNPGKTEDWLGTRMYWSGFDEKTNTANIKDAGFTIVESEILSDNEDGRLVPFQWVIATKSGSDTGPT